ncbi:MAG TPA: hypothetical protein VFD67_06070, partial [Gemmatimonadaceae bacterium]|nr:hypothetical protein [Gemmatimonadaceae bacterium]
KRIFSAFAVSLLATSTAAAQGMKADEENAADFLVGSWQCADTVGDYNGSYTITVTKALSGRWLREIYQWHNAAAPRALSGEYFLSYDPRVKKWIRIGAMNDGMYFSMVGVRAGDDWTFGYALPGPGTAVYSRRSDTDYTVLGPTYKENGKVVTEHHGCHKASP